MGRARRRPERRDRSAAGERLAADTPPGPRRELVPWKKLAFAIPTSLGFLLLLETLLWACGVRPAYTRRDPFAGFTPQVPHFQVEKDAAGEEVVTLVPTKRAALNEVRFPRRKPAGTFRIVVLGGSATYGRPFYDHTSFAGWLRAMLPRADPSRRWEVVNAGAISYASYRIKGLMAELAGYDPDLFIVYTGENEFLERRTYAEVFGTPGLIRNAAGLASRLRIATVMQRALETAGLLRPPGADASTAPRPTGIQEDVHRIAVDAVGPEAYTRDEVFCGQVLAHFEASLESMVETAARAGALLLFVTPVSNLRDFAPFKSENRKDLATLQLAGWRDALGKGRALLAQGRPADALAAFEPALALDNRHADLLYRNAQALLALGRDHDARIGFERARDEDICPLRAQSATLEVLRSVAARRSVPLLDWEPIAWASAAHGIPGDDLLCDHVHLQTTASRMLATELLSWLASRKIVSLAPEWGPTAMEEVVHQVEAGIDRPRYAAELFNLSRLLAMLGQPEPALRRVEEGLRMNGGNVEGYCLGAGYAAVMGDRGKARDWYQKALALQPGAACAEEGLGGLLLEEKKPAEALVHLEAALRSIPESPVLLNRLGVAHAELDRHDRAVDWFGRALKVNPREAAIHRNLAYSEERLGHLERAVAHYREAARLRPDDPVVAAALQRLLGSASPPPVRK